mmetsp:Transcript_41473/g.63286  ORF Transcript_41473/g.63286 Transcript_41473/m.63286 type:complete len:103 (+) Transcript_41473:1301-1609(+)
MQSLNNFTFQDTRLTPAKDSFKALDLKQRSKETKTFLNNLDLAMSSNSSFKLDTRGPVHLQEEAIELKRDSFGRAEGSGTWRSARSGIMAQLNNLSNSGALR